MSRSVLPVRVRVAIVLSAVVIGLAATTVSLAAGRGEPGPLRRAAIPVSGDDTALLKVLHDLDIDVDAVFHDRVRVYVVDEEIEKLGVLGLRVEIVQEPPPGTLGGEQPGVDGPPLKYHTYETLTADLQAIAADHPAITRLTAIGQSVSGRTLWMLKISANPDLDEDEPEFLYVAAMHGDEVVGKELVFQLADLLTDGYGSDPRLTALIDETEIWILPSMNPDGTAASRRYNDGFIDLNRDFPDQFVDPVNTIAGRAPETAAVMTWSLDRRISLSANYHGGALVANYPFDSTVNGASVYSPSPDDDLFRSLARTYADANPAMAASNGHPSFNHGVCNGSDWYAINGGMQDWAWIWGGDADLTIEVSAIKWPAASTLSGYWDDNVESMLSFMERVHEGARGIVTDAVTGTPLAATVHVAGNPYPTYADPDVGDWHRVMEPGSYDLEISAPGHVTRLLPGVVVTPGDAVRVDADLAPLATDLQPVAGCVDAGPTCEPWLTVGTSSDLTVTLRNAGTDATGITARLESIGGFASAAGVDADYPDIVAGAAGDSAAPGHAIEVSSAAPVGHKAGFVVRWSSAEGAGVSEPLFLPVDARSCVSVAAGGLPLSIADRATVENSLEILDQLEVTDVEVTVDVTHTYRNDLRIDLVSPAGTSVVLHNRSGGSADDVAGVFGVDLTPFVPLSRLDGESSAGMWTLRVDDGVPGNTGSLEAWSARVCGRPFEASTPEMRLADVARTPGGVAISWWPYPGVTDFRVYRSSDPSLPGGFVDVTAEDGDPTDTRFDDAASGEALYWIVTGVGPRGEGPKGHFGE